MSKDTKTKDLNYYIDWLKKSIDNENIKLYEYQSFKDIQWKGSGSYGNVYRVNLENSNRLFALKSFVNVNNKQTFEEVLKELKLHRSVDCHENIIRLYGITNVKFDAIQNCSFVLEYADSGTLNTYLTDHFSELDWSDKYHLASQLASAIEFLHGEDIIHRDLHGDNILINQKNIKLADFGLSKKIIEASSSTSKVLGVMPYVDPKSFDDKEKYKLNKKSDVYSVGVLLWQISSGYKPFHEVDHSVSLMLSILKGKREKIIDGTPVKYSDLYRECWRGEPNKRPNIREVVSTLKSIIEIDTTTDHTNEKKETHSRNEDEIISESSKRTKDLNDELMPNSELNSIPSGSNKKFEGSINEIIISKDESNIIKEDENRMASNQKYGSPSNANASDQVNQVTGSSISLINFLDVDKLIAFIIKKHDNGITFDQAQQLISKQILQTNQTTDQLIKWLSENQDKTQYIWFLGLFYYYNIGVEDDIKAFEWFSKAAEDNYSIAQVYLAKCYYDGYGTTCNIKLAFHWYQKSVENG
ncbi:kinase-like domain-containing protein, partial [Rhizophagus irregularis DAOM 181602=DAOM 197198]